MTIRSKQRHSASSEQRAEIAELRGRYDLLTHREHKLDTCETTVKIHSGHVMRKMRSGSLTDLVRMAERLGDV
jgi:DNA-binding NarL/FixJ family response regulator